MNCFLIIPVNRGLGSLSNTGRGQLPWYLLANLQAPLNTAGNQTDRQTHI